MALSSIGFVGGGQLALMTAQVARRMKSRSIGSEVEVNVLDPDPLCPAHSVAAHHVVSDFSDPSGLRRLAEVSDVVSYEIELGDARVIAELRDSGVRVLPSPETLGTIQDKYVQKRFLASKGIAVPTSEAVGTLDELRSAVKDLGLPSMLKRRKGGYDGRGNFLLRSEEDLERGHTSLGGRDLMLEEFVSWNSEVSVIGARDGRGEVRCFPPGENVHEGGILRLTKSPAGGSTETAGEAERVARRVLDAFGDVGVFGIEMFDAEGEILVNEVAPRVHNSGHGTLEEDAFTTSQFEQHIRAVTGMPLAAADVMRPVVMHNILGDENGYSGPYAFSGLREAESLGARLHLYGKVLVKPRRKMGHLAVVGERLNDEKEMERLVERAKRARAMIGMVGQG